MSPQNISPSRPPKTIVLAFDGTANKFGACNTNIIRLFSLLEKEKPEEQMVYYQPGLGTYLASEAAWSPTEKVVSELMDKAFARYLDVHVGLLLPGTDQMVASAYERYLDLSPGGDQLASNFKDAFSIDCPIEFLGLWDTVSSVGIVNSKHLPFTASNSQVKTVRHALSLDEHRAKFKPNRWHQSSSACQEKTAKLMIRQAFADVIKLQEILMLPVPLEPIKRLT
ncbi:hypothetical protein FS837_012291 [Tulasnella sp. UAMH 9824]|nr:hypothetical protein FS837_012291 [Tulasnella sp. UAMH 9824]